MKKIALIISLVAVFALTANAQKGKYAYGLKLGPNLNWVTTTSDKGQNDGTRMGFGFGFFVDRLYTQHVALSSGLSYNVYGLKYQFTDYRLVNDFLEPAYIDVNRKFKGSFLEVPLKVKVKFDVMDSWKAFAEGGAALGINLTAKAKDNYNYYGLTHADDDFLDASDQYRRFQLALRFGLGAEYEITSKLSVFAQLCYGHGLTNVFTRTMERQTGSNLKTNYIGLEIGVIH